MDWPLLLAGIIAIVPALLILLASYAPFDGHFKDNVLFLFFMGGLAAGMGAVFFESLLRLPVGNPTYTLAMLLVGFPVFEQALKLVVLNRRQHQGEGPVPFYGGAFGLGFAVMLVLSKSQPIFFTAPELPMGMYRELGTLFAAPANALYLLLGGLGLLLFHFAAGIIVGDGVRTRALRSSLLLAIAAAVPLHFFLFLFTGGLRVGLQGSDLVWLALLVAYAGILAWWAHSTLLPKALPPAAQRKRRKALLDKRRAEVGKE